MKSKWKPALFIPFLTIFIDQWSKFAVVEKFYLGESITVIPNYFNITYVRNTGAAFGIMADSPSWFRVPFFTIVPLIALWVIAYLFKKLEDDNWIVASALSLVVGGAIGNLIDRIRVGYVIDFLDFHWKYESHFPAFNVADAAICVGVAILLIDVFNGTQKEKLNAPHSS
jgi:signal peptidase II